MCRASVALCQSRINKVKSSCVNQVPLTVHQLPFWAVSGSNHNTNAGLRHALVDVPLHHREAGQPHENSWGQAARRMVEQSRGFRSREAADFKAEAFVEGEVGVQQLDNLQIGGPSGIRLEQVQLLLGAETHLDRIVAAVKLSKVVVWEVFCCCVAELAFKGKVVCLGCAP